MENSYDVEAAARLVQELSPRASELLALRTYTARLLGREPALVVHGGGTGACGSRGCGVCARSTR
jgi:rhamnose utilization protein RhaD (predicted bifunctional aldolase and dehydrogenase)